MKVVRNVPVHVFFMVFHKAVLLEPAQESSQMTEGWIKRNAVTLVLFVVFRGAAAERGKRLDSSGT